MQYIYIHHMVSLCGIPQVYNVHLMFMGPCIVIIFRYIIPTRCTSHKSLFNLTIALHISGVTITHLQEYKTTASTASGNRYTVLLSAAIVKNLQLM